MTQAKQLGVAVRRLLEGVIIIIFLLVLSAVSPAFPGANVAFLSDITIGVIMQLVVAVVLAAALLALRSPLDDLFYHYLGRRWRSGDSPKGEELVSPIRSIGNLAVNLILLVLTYAALAGPLGPFLSLVAVPTWIVGVFFFLLAWVLVLLAVRKARPLLDELGTKLGERVVSKTAAKARCSRCGKNVLKRSKFCPECGALLLKVKE